ncbi:septum formation inhibitor Maf [Winogradskyella aurantia]|uniref:Septum formation inhibitor Maf n=1 Tax=Winogradskyella aurantia TaxID=1915063 RepID=A0A265UWT2_9FLAO|nr:septum formation inhibitor Maf [Winogradskyella aurantia]OZV69768.1 septum formation inhibitor Maf [Winogradskyella aurantia]
MTLNTCHKLFVVAITFLTLNSCIDKTSNSNDVALKLEENTKIDRPKPTLSNAFKDYWYAGEAEITSYKLEQARYGEMRDGTAVLVFVTEDFLPKAQVKADTYSDTNIPVLKLNATKNFNTGIYPYSIMQSTFYPVANSGHAIKASASIQEWCGLTYAQLNNRDKFEITLHSYFQGEADTSYEIEKTWTENELWAKLRIDPKSLPTGTLQIVPSLEFTRLRHKPIKAYEAFATLENSSYTVTYPDLDRTLKINFNTDFPYDILGWEETTVSGYGANSKTLTTKATKLESIKSAYWTKNSNANEGLREMLKLE